MKMGDKNQAVILSLVAVGAVAFLVFQLMPGKVKSSLMGSSASPSQAPSVATVAELPLMVTGDPFSHPKLAIKPPPKTTAVEPQRDISGHLPVNPGLGNPALGSDSGSDSTSDSGSDSGSSSGLGPEDSAGKSQQKAKGPQITVMAVLQAGTPVAMLQVGSNESRTYAEGEMLAAGIRLVKVGDSYVLVRIHGVIHQISTGDSYQPDDGDSK